MINIKTQNHNADWQKIRQSVFVEEQGFENEFDEIDKSAHHVVLYVDDMAVGCGRTYFSKHDSLWHLGRLAILKAYRHFGYGAIIISHLEDYAKSAGATMMYLSAQQHAIPFYQRQGYMTFGDCYLDEHVLHQDMRKEL